MEKLHSEEKSPKKQLKIIFISIFSRSLFLNCKKNGFFFQLISCKNFANFDSKMKTTHLSAEPALNTDKTGFSSSESHSPKIRLTVAAFLKKNVNLIKGEKTEQNFELNPIS